MDSQSIGKALELLGGAHDELNPIYARGQEVSDIYDELPALGELYRYLEGMMGTE